MTESKGKELKAEKKQQRCVPCSLDRTFISFESRGTEAKKKASPRDVQKGQQRRGPNKKNYWKSVSRVKTAQNPNRVGPGKSKKNLKTRSRVGWGWVGVGVLGGIGSKSDAWLKMNRRKENQNHR